LILTTLTLSHLRREDTGSDGVDTNLKAVVADLEAENLSKVNNGCLRGIVGKVVLSSLDDSADRADINDTAREAVLVFGSLLEQRQEAHGHEEALRDVGLVGIGPVLNVGVGVVEKVSLHLLGSLGLGLHGVGRNASAGRHVRRPALRTYGEMLTC